MKKGYPEFHCHIQSLDSASLPETFVKREIELESGAITVTDHGTLQAGRKVYDLAKENGLIPILGQEAYLKDPNDPILLEAGIPRTADKDLNLSFGEYVKYTHLTMHHMDQEAYETGVRVLSRAALNRCEKHGSEEKPLYDWNDLEEIGATNSTFGSSCFVPGTLVPLVGRGLFPIELIEPGNLIWDKDGIPRKVIEPTIRPYSGEIIEIKIASILEKIQVTPDHLFLQCTGPGKFEWKEARHIKTGDRLKIMVESREDKRTLPFVFRRKNIKHSGATEVISGDLADPETLWAIGLFIAEGSWSKKDVSLQFSLHKKEDDKGVRIRKWAMSLGASSVAFQSKKSSPNSLTVVVHGAAITEWFTELFGGHPHADRKHIPECLKELHPDLLRHLVLGYWEGDGHFKYRTYEHVRTGTFNVRRSAVATVSRLLANDMSAIFRRVGLWLNAHIKRSSIGKDGTNHREAYYLLNAGDDAENLYKWLHGVKLSINKEFTANVSKISKTQYTGNVHCLSIQDQPSFSLEGGVVVHNCLIGSVARFVMQHKRLDIAEKYYCKLRGTVKPGNFYAEVFPHVCSTNWDSACTVTYSDGTTEKFKPHKQLKTNKWKGKAEEISQKWDDKIHQGAILEEVMDNRVWTPRTEQKIITHVGHVEGYIPNDCCPQWPDGDLQLYCNKFILAMATKYKDPICLSGDSHFAYSDEKIIQDVRLQAGGGSWRFAQSHHRMDSSETFAYFQDKFKMSEKSFEKLIDNNYEWADRFKGFEFKDRTSLPVKFYPSDTIGHTIELIKRQGRMKWDDPVWTQRLAEEIKLLSKNGTFDFLPYFMLGEEVVRQAEARGILPGPGRGSSAGLLLTYVLGVTHLDPLRYGLSKDRFMTLDRIQQGRLPDIDQDLESREWLMDPKTGWLKERFGDHVVQVSTDTTLKLRSSVKDVSRVIHEGKIPFEVEQLTKKFQNAPQGISDRDFVFGYKRESDDEWVDGSIKTDLALQEYISKYPKEWAIAQRCLGLVRQRSIHPCGTLITNEPVSNFIPLQMVGDIPVTQYTASSCERSGAIKMDFLGINSLKDIKQCIELVQSRSNQSLPEIKGVPGMRLVPYGDKWLDIWDLPEEQEVFVDICEGRTETVFQLEAEGAKKWMKAFNKRGVNGKKALSSILDLAAFTALDRPGPLDYMIKDADGKELHNMLIEYAHRASGEEAFGRLPILDELFKETHGVIIFQEQLTKAFREIGGTTGIEAENFRVHIGKKQMMKVYKDKALFMPGATEKLGEKVAEELWKSMETFGQYGFCKAHASAYMVTAYACAWLKHHYPLEWWTAVLQNAGRAEINEKFWRYCGHLIQLPDISLSAENFWITKDDRILAPVSLLEGVGPKAQEQINALRPFADISDLAVKVEAWRIANATKTEKGMRKATSALNAGVIKSLILSGVADSLWPKGLSVAEKLDSYFVATAAAQNRKRKKTEIVNDKWTSFNDLQAYMIKKSVLPAYSKDIRPMMAELQPHNFKKGPTWYQYSYEHGGEIDEIPLISADDFAGLGVVDYIPPGGLTIALACYIISDTEKKYHIKKTMRILMLDIEGIRIEMIKWPDRGSDKMPLGFPKDMTGCAVVVLANKYTLNKPFTIENVLVVQHPMEATTQEEGSS